MSAHESKFVIYAALAGNLMIAVSKFLAAWYTGSSAMLSEAIHSLVDTGNQGLMLHGMRQATKPGTLEHPFGYGLQLYFWTFIVAVLIFGLGAGVALVEGIEKIQHPHQVENLVVNYIVLGGSILFEGASWIVVLRSFGASKGRRNWFEAIEASKDPTVFTVLFEDTAALLGLFIAAGALAVGQIFDLPIMDGVASVLIGILLAATASLLVRESKSLLTGEGVNPEVRASLHKLALAEPGISALNELRTMHFGPRDVLVTLSLDFVDDQLASSVESTVTRLERKIKATHPEVTRVFIEAQSFDESRRSAAAQEALAEEKA